MIMNSMTYPDRMNLSTLFFTQPPKFDFVLLGLLAGTVGMLNSPGGTGKSTLALQIAAGVAIGSDDMGLGIDTSGDVLIIAAEDNQTVLHHRLHALGVQYTQDSLNTILERVDIRCCVGLGIDIMDDDWVVWLQKQAQGKRMVIIDTLTRVHCLDECDSSAAKKIMMIFEKIAVITGAAILVLHHISKASALGGWGGEQHASRGSSVFVDNSRWVEFIAGMQEKEAGRFKVVESRRNRYIRFNVSKHNYSDSRMDVWFERGAGGILKSCQPGVKAPLSIANAKNYSVVTDGGTVEVCHDW